ncbi:MAG: hypothetical protein IJU16_05945 [Clostridia bacterium]|nr:hypothetical protein [Clostridia bacterium]
MKILRAGIVLIGFLALLLFGGCEQPAYYHPYDDTSGTTMSGQAETDYTQPSMTALRIKPATTTTVPAPTAPSEIPDGYQLCPTCGGVKQLCPYCKGTGKRRGEVLDPNTGIYKWANYRCAECADGDPGYVMCETCHNELIVPIEGTTE